MTEKEFALGLEFEVPVAKAILEFGFREFTEIQKKTIPLIQQGKDVIGQSSTGSGKTLAFGIPSMEKVERFKGIQFLIITPTRELCEQVTRELRKVSKYKSLNVNSLYGGVDIKTQLGAMKYAEVVVATPGRLLDHIKRQSINLEKLKILVLDEADKMLELGFINDVEKILEKLPQDKQTLLFSATIPQKIQNLTREYMRSPIRITTKSYVDSGQLLHFYYPVDQKDKFSLLVQLLNLEQPRMSLIFCSTRNMVDDLVDNLAKYNIKSMGLHGGLTQEQRREIVQQAHAMNAKILVATDVAARGLDFKDITHVFNFDMPKTSSEYIHRSGRTARAGNQGKVISLISLRDQNNYKQIIKDEKITIRELKVPGFNKLKFQMTHGIEDKDRKEFYRRDLKQEYKNGQNFRNNNYGNRRDSHNKRFGTTRYKKFNRKNR
ncbi:putative ATP-dependent RNA helicase [uncultured archaeon]|nr:putative ATP-dependent RNA helicase [uncultured archaeon]